MRFNSSTDQTADQSPTLLFQSFDIEKNLSFIPHLLSVYSVAWIRFEYSVDPKNRVTAINRKAKRSVCPLTEIGRHLDGNSRHGHKVGNGQWQLCFDGCALISYVRGWVFNSIPNTS